MEENNFNYKDIENRRKAEKVRKLIRQYFEKQRIGYYGPDYGANDLAEAQRLSRELARYLRENYPSKFKIKTYVTKPEEWEDLKNHLLFGDKKGKHLFEDIMKEKDAKIHDILHIENYNPDIGQTEIITIFVDEDGFHSGLPYYPESDQDGNMGPDEWYYFTERMGLLPRQAAYLYKGDPSVGSIFYTPGDKWPVVGEIKERLI